MKWNKKSKSIKVWKPVVFILPEWKTEQQYFKLLKRLLQKRNKIFVLPEESWKIDKNNLEVSFKNIEKKIKNTFTDNQLSYKDLRKSFTKAFVILDSDVYQNKNKIKKYFEKKYIKVIFVNPCFEKFLLYHFTNKCFNLETCNDCINTLKNYIKNYKKWHEKQIENIVKNYKQAMNLLKKCKDNDDLLDFLEWLENL